MLKIYSRAELLHLILLLILAGYPLLRYECLFRDPKKNEYNNAKQIYRDIGYLIFFAVIIGFWVFYKNECPTAYYEKKAVDPNYTYGRCPGVSSLNYANPPLIIFIRIFAVIGWSNIILSCGVGLKWHWRFLLFAIQFGFYLWSYFGLPANQGEYCMELDRKARIAHETL